MSPSDYIAAAVVLSLSLSLSLSHFLSHQNPQPSAQAHPKQQQQRRRRLILPTLPAEVAAEERCYCRGHRGADRNTRRGLLHKGSRSETTVEPTSFFIFLSCCPSISPRAEVPLTRFPSAAWSSSEDHLTSLHQSYILEDSSSSSSSTLLPE